MVARFPVMRTDTASPGFTLADVDAHGVSPLEPFILTHVLDGSTLVTVALTLVGTFGFAFLPSMRAMSRASPIISPSPTSRRRSCRLCTRWTGP